MGETAMLRLAKGENIFLSSMLSDSAMVLGEYISKPFAISGWKRELLDKTKSYFETAKEGLEYQRNTTTSGLSFESLRSLNAINEIMLVSENREDIDDFLEDISMLLSMIEENRESDNTDKVKRLIEFFLQLSKELKRSNYHPEANRSL